MGKLWRVLIMVPRQQASLVMVFARSIFQPAKLKILFLLIIVGLNGCSINSVNNITSSNQRSENSLWEERILFDRKLDLFSVRPDGSDERLIDTNVVHEVSPDGRYLLVIDYNSFKSDKLKVKVYDLQKRIVSSKTFPDGTWVLGDGWWSDDGKQFMLYQATDYSGKAVSSLSSMDSYQAKVTKLLHFDVTTGRLIYEDISPDSTVKEFREFKRPPIKLELVSPDHNYRLKCEGKRLYWHDARGYFDIYLNSLMANKKTMIYKSESFKFGNRIEISDLPWSPDGKRFVVALFDRGFLSQFFHDVLISDN